MIRCQSELFQSSVKLVDGLKMNTKEDLKQMAENIMSTCSHKTAQR